MAESGGKEPSFVVAGLTVWALVEIGLTWWRVVRRTTEPPGKVNLSLALALVICVRPGLDIVTGLVQPWAWQVGMAIAPIVVIAACYLLRHHLAALRRAQGA